MKKQEIYLSSSKHKSDSPKEMLLEFENGSKIISIDSSIVGSVTRGERSKIIWVDGKYLKQENRKFQRNYINELKLKWHQKLRVELDYLWEDILDWVRYIFIKKGV